MMPAPMNPAVTTMNQNNLAYFPVVEMYVRPWMVDDSRKFLIFSILQSFLISWKPGLGNTDVVLMFGFVLVLVGGTQNFYWICMFVFTFNPIITHLSMPFSLMYIMCTLRSIKAFCLPMLQSTYCKFESWTKEQLLLTAVWVQVLHWSCSKAHCRSYNSPHCRNTHNNLPCYPENGHNNFYVWHRKTIERNTNPPLDGCESWLLIWASWDGVVVSPGDHSIELLKAWCVSRARTLHWVNHLWTT